MIASYWEPFARLAPPKFALLSPSHWLDHFLHSYTSCPPLFHALLAVSVVRLSKTNNRLDIAKKGRGLYIQSMQLTRRAITSSELSTNDEGNVNGRYIVMKHMLRVLIDEVLAGVCVMVLYELADSDSGNVNGWLNHLTGLARLMEHRGAVSHKSAPARAILEFSRYLLMLRHLLARRATIFSQDVWLRVPWEDTDKSARQQVFDHGLRLATVFERCDLACDNQSSVPTASEIIYECDKIYDSLQVLQEEHISPNIASGLDSPPRPSTASLELPYPAALSLSITALGVQLGASQSASRLMTKIIAPAIERSARDEAIDDLGAIPEYRTSRSLNNRQALAQQIVCEISCCLDHYAGAMGAARMVFCLHIAMLEFGPLDDDFARCRTLLERLSGRASIFDSMVQPTTPLDKPECGDTERSLLEYRFKKLELMSRSDMGISQCAIVEPI